MFQTKTVQFELFKKSDYTGAENNIFISIKISTQKITSN